MPRQRNKKLNRLWVGLQRSKDSIFHLIVPKSRADRDIRRPPSWSCIDRWSLVVDVKDWIYRSFNVCILGERSWFSRPFPIGLERITHREMRPRRSVVKFGSICGLKGTNYLSDPIEWQICMPRMYMLADWNRWLQSVLVHRPRQPSFIHSKDSASTPMAFAGTTVSASILSRWEPRQIPDPLWHTLNGDWRYRSVERQLLTLARIP